MILKKVYQHVSIAILTLTAVYPETSAPSDEWDRFNDWTIADTIFPNLNLHGVGGFSTGHLDELATGGHDPLRKKFSAQSIEPSLSLRTEYFEAFSNYIFFQDEDANWDSELEELFGKIVNIPGGFEIKGGQYLARFGSINDKHIHRWDFVDVEMPISRFLGDEGLFIRGVEVSWTLPLDFDSGLTSIASLGYGKIRPHEEDGHGGGGSRFEGEEGNLSENILTARLIARKRFTDFHTVTGGLSYAGGDNEFGRGTSLVGLDAEYQWRENGLEAGGRALRWANELIWRRVNAEEEGPPVDRGNFEEIGFYSTATYTWNNHFDTSLRVSWLEGVEDLGLEERFRVSPAVTYWLDEQRRVGVRTQYNYDRFAGGPEEHSLWFQLNVSLGTNQEVR